MVAVLDASGTESCLCLAKMTRQEVVVHQQCPVFLSEEGDSQYPLKGLHGMQIQQVHYHFLPYGSRGFESRIKYTQVISIIFT